MGTSDGQDAEQSQTGDRRSSADRFILAVALFMFLILLLRTAWVCDDAYITLRVVDNFIEGYGPRYNIEERVQAFTHPLWFLLLSFPYFVTREPYLTTLAVSLGVSTAALCWAVLRLGFSGWVAAAAVLTLCCSRAFIDFATSGLENPLGCLLVAIFLGGAFAPQSLRPSLRWFAFLAALLSLTRNDLLLVVLPFLILEWRRMGWIRGVSAILLGVLPFIGWTLFSLVYYGLPFPNTAYAKLGAGVPSIFSFIQGVHYFLNSVEFDPATLFLILLGVGAAFSSGESGRMMIGLGVVLYLVYVVRVGGDFMSGRFFAVPVFVSVLLSARRIMELPGTGPGLAAGGVLAAALFLCTAAPDPPWAVTEEMKRPKSDAELKEMFSDKTNGITNERAYYFAATGLLTRRDGFREDFPKQSSLDRLKPQVLVTDAVGIFGYRAGREVHMIDIFALVDPLLARLPAVQAYRGEPRIGHFTRTVPAGYISSVERGENHLEDPGLNELYSHLLRITRGPLFSLERLQSIWEINTGRLDDLVDASAFMNPDRMRVKAEEVSRPLPDFAPVDHPAARPFGNHGVEIEFGDTTRSREVEVSLNAGVEFVVIFVDGYRERGRVELSAWPAMMGLKTRKLNSPSDARNLGYDRIRIIPASPDAASVLGHVRLTD